MSDSLSIGDFINIFGYQKRRFNRLETESRTFDIRIVVGSLLVE